MSKVSRGSNIYNVDDCVKRLAEREEITLEEAYKQFNGVILVLAEAIISGGVSIRDVFTIRKTFRTGRKGVVRGEEFESKDKYTLNIRAGKKLSEMMN